jgi:hypothetical protein
MKIAKKGVKKVVTDIIPKYYFVEVSEFGVAMINRHQHPFDGVNTLKQ